MIGIARLTLVSLCVLLPRVAAGQAVPDREGVRLAVLDYVEGFYEGDTTRLQRSVSPEVHKYGYYKEKADGPYIGEGMPFPAFMTYANRIRTGKSRTPAGAVKEIAVYDVQDQTASAKLTAWWGTDYLLLAKDQGRWKIIHVLWQSPPPK